MAALSFNWPTFHHNTTVPPLPELLPFHHDNSINPLLFESNNQFSSFNNGVITTKNNLPFHNPIKYPTLSSSSSSYNPLVPNVFHHGYFSNPLDTNVFDDHDFFQIYPKEKMQPEPLSIFSDIYECGASDFCSMEQLHQPELPPFPDTYLGSGSGFPEVCPMEKLYPKLSLFSDIYHGGGSGTQLQLELPPLPEIYSSGDGSDFGPKCNVIHGEERRISAQSMAARVRRRKISEKTLELGKLVPGGHRMTTAEMFQAAFKYIKFLQAQVGVLQLMPSSPELNGELQALVTCPSIQEKLYAAGKCIVTQTLAETLADDHQGTTNK